MSRKVKVATSLKLINLKITSIDSFFVYILFETKYYSTWGFVDKTHFPHCSGFSMEQQNLPNFVEFHRICG